MLPTLARLSPEPVTAGFFKTTYRQYGEYGFPAGALARAIRQTKNCGGG